VTIRIGAIFLVSGFLVAGKDARAQSLEGGRKTFELRCARCHGADGGGGEMGPPLGLKLSAITDVDLVKLIHDGRPLRGMPGTVMPAPEMAGLQEFLRAIQQDAPPVVRRTVQTTDGRTLEGELLGEGASDLQLRTADKHVQLLRREGDRFRAVTSEKDWPSTTASPAGTGIRP
jgi:alcohol dehydrogenase (cytochrome c)